MKICDVCGNRNFFAAGEAVEACKNCAAKFKKPEKIGVEHCRGTKEQCLKRPLSDLSEPRDLLEW